MVIANAARNIRHRCASHCRNRDSADAPTNHFVSNRSFKATLSKGNFPNYVRLAITRSGADLDPGINNALAKSIAASLHHLVQAAQHEPCRRRITATMRSCHDCIVRPATRNSISVERGKREAPRVVSMKTKCFAHIDALRSSISRPHQKLGFLAPPQPHSSGAQVDAEQPDLFEQAPPDREACTEWRLLRRRRTAGSRHHDQTNQAPHRSAAKAHPQSTEASPGPSPAECVRQSNRRPGNDGLHPDKQQASRARTVHRRR